MRRLEALTTAHMCVLMLVCAALLWGGCRAKRGEPEGQTETRTVATEEVDMEANEGDTWQDHESDPWDDVGEDTEEDDEGEDTEEDDMGEDIEEDDVDSDVNMSEE